MLLVDQYRHLGEQVPLGLARRATDELLATEWDGASELPQLPEAPTAADNDAALASLMSQMGGLSA